MERFIKKKFSVEEPSLKKTYRIGEATRGWIFNPKTHNIFFIGLRGSGKTTVGKLVADKLDMIFMDTDEEFVSRVGENIEDFVEKNGWDRFREEESKILKDACEKKGIVCATGGGIILRDENRELIKKSGFVFYLMSDIPTLEKRIISDKNNKNRPPLSDLSLREELIQCLREREPFYLSTAHFILRAEKEVPELIGDVFQFLGVKK